MIFAYKMYKKISETSGIDNESVIPPDELKTSNPWMQGFDPLCLPAHRVNPDVYRKFTPGYLRGCKLRGN
jgi:hypothetical protein